MGSPITLSGFNSIDFGMILNAIMQQERIPVVRLEAQKQALEAQRSAYSTFASKLAALESAAGNLAAATAFDGTQATVSDSSRLSVSASGTASAGTYEVVVQQLAKAQVTTSSTSYADADTTIIATRGTVNVGGAVVTLSGGVTLQGLADAINASANVPATASVVRTDAGYRLMLTGKQTGAAQAFTVSEALSGGPGLKFNKTNDQNAQNAKALFNNVALTSATNEFASVVPGVSFTALKPDTVSPVVITITASSESVKALVEKLVTAFREVAAFLAEQQKAAGEGDADSIGRDPSVRGLRGRLTSLLTARYGGGGSFASLAEIGFEFTRTGEFTFDSARFDQALASSKASVVSLFRGADGEGGVFGALADAIAQYTAAGGLVPAARRRLDGQLVSLSTRIAGFEERLAVRREALQREFIAADQAIAQLNAAQAQLSSMASQFGMF